MTALSEFDTVEVLVPLDQTETGKAPIPAGARAAIVDLGADHALIEVVQEDGCVHGPYGVALSDLRFIAGVEA